MFRRLFVIGTTFVILVLTSAACTPESPTDAAPPETATVSEPPTPSATPEPTATPEPPTSITILGLEDGDTVTLTEGVLGPEALVTVEATGLVYDDRVYLQADGLVMAMERNSQALPTFTTELPWWPWHGNGDYELLINLCLADFGCYSTSERLTVTVADFPAGTPTIRDRFISLYQQNFDITLTAPAVSRYVKPWDDVVDDTRWVSVAYIGDMLYRIDLFDDGTTSVIGRPLNHMDLSGWMPICRPTGDYQFLVIFVDYGNTGLTQEDVLSVLDMAAAEYNQVFMDLSVAQGLDSPILHVETTGAYVTPPPQHGDVFPGARIEELTGYDPDAFDIIVQVDMDANMTFSQTFGAVGFGGTGCWDTERSAGIDIYFPIRNREDLMDEPLLGSVFDHEFSHCMGWEHAWPNGDASVAEQFVVDWQHNATFPTMLFGWEDMDGDGIVEILDPDPYGMTGE